VIDLFQAYPVLFAPIRPLPVVTMPLGDALFRTLARPVVCDIDYPPFDRSVMDGYAVRASDVARAPLNLTIIGRVAAGTESTEGLRAGTAMYVGTGAPIPTGADAVVRVEQTEIAADGREVRIRSSVLPGQFITPKASYARAGQIVLKAGQGLTPLEIAVAAAAGAATVTVYRRPTVAILSTGDELVDIGTVPKGAQIRNSNAVLLNAAVRAAHAEPLMLGTAKDDPAVIRAGIEAGLSADQLCITGGVSVGERDFVPRVLREMGAEFHIEKIKIKPGRPILFAGFPRGPLVFALPGNPVSAFVGFELLVRPALAALEGRPGRIPRPFPAVLRGSLPAAADRRTFWPAHATVQDDGQWCAEALPWGGSGDPFGMAGANALLTQPPHSPALQSGGSVSILLLERV
jgi:molybdopterin molybdotransferase